MILISNLPLNHDSVGSGALSGRNGDVQICTATELLAAFATVLSDTKDAALFHALIRYLCEQAELSGHLFALQRPRAASLVHTLLGAGRNGCPVCCPKRVPCPSSAHLNTSQHAVAHLAGLMLRVSSDALAQLAPDLLNCITVAAPQSGLQLCLPEDVTCRVLSGVFDGALVHLSHVTCSPGVVAASLSGAAVQNAV